MSQTLKDQLTGSLEVVPARQVGGNALTPLDMLSRAIEKGATMDVLEKFMALHERYEASQARKAFDEAMADAKAEIPTINKNRKVDFTSAKGRTNYRYEDLAEIARTVDPILSRFGLSYRFRTTSQVNEPITVTCIVSHRGGHSEENTLAGPRDESGNKNAIQAIGSTLTYLQRMTLKAALGLSASEDDDGRDAGLSGVVTDKQRDELAELIEASGTDLSKFCGLIGVDALSKVAAKDFEGVKLILTQKKAVKDATSK